MAKKKQKQPSPTLRTGGNEISKPRSFDKVYWTLCILICILKQGAFFADGLFVLTLFCLGYLLLRFPERITVDVNLIGLAGILLFAILSFAMKSIDKYVAFVDLQKFAILFLSYFIFSNMKSLHAVEKCFYIGIFVTMLCGLLGMTGMEPFDELITEKGRRLQSFLQYANTTALFMGIGVFLSIDKLIKTKKYRYIPFCALFAAAMFFTQSRITLVTFVGVFLLYILLSLPRKFKLIFGGALLAFLLIILFIGGRIIRISLFEPTLVERFITYIDAIKAVIPKPILGIGLGNWQYLSFALQSAPYQVRYIHNLYLQIALDAGILAAIALIGMAGYAILRNLKKRTIHFYIFIFTVLQSIFEINFNFGIFNLYFALLLAILSRDGAKSPEFRFDIPKPVKYVKSTAIVCCIVFLCVLGLSENFISRGDFAMKQGHAAAAVSCYQKSHALNPANHTVLFKLAQAEKNPDKAIAYLESTLDKNPYQFLAKNSLVEGYLYRGNYPEAMDAAASLLESFPYNKAFQELSKKTITTAYEQGVLDEVSYGAQIKAHEAFISEKNAEIHPLYIYIDPEMDY